MTCGEDKKRDRFSHAAPLHPLLLSEAEKIVEVPNLKHFPANISINASNFDCNFTKFRLLHKLVQGSIPPAPSPGILVGEESRGSGGRAMTSKETYCQNFVFYLFSCTLFCKHTGYTFLIFLKKSEISAGEFDPSPATQNAGSTRPDPPIGDDSAPCTKTK